MIMMQTILISNRLTKCRKLLYIQEAAQASRIPHLEVVVLMVTIEMIRMMVMVMRKRVAISSSSTSSNDLLEMALCV